MNFKANNSLFLLMIFLTFLLTGCPGGGGDSDNDPDDTTDTTQTDDTNGTDTDGSTNEKVKLSGVVMAPSGGIASLQNPSFQHMLADLLLGKAINAATTDWVAIASGIEVNLLEIDATGATVSTLATTTTAAGGTYEFSSLPDGFEAGAQYVIRAGTSDSYIETRVPVESGTLDIDPGSHAASALVSEVISAWDSSLSDLDVSELETILSETEAVLEDIDFNEVTATTVEGVATEIKNTLKDDETKANVVFSAGAKGAICGNVKDSNDQALANVLIVARDFGNWVTRAKAKTDSSGNYCINVPKAGDTDPYTSQAVSGTYILGAVNKSTSNMAASQWWTSTSSTADGSGGANNQFAAEMITVADTSTGETADFVLDANGARISGSVTTHDGGSAAGLQVLVREYGTFKPLAASKIKADGSYAINVKATNAGYSVVFRNRTIKPYASEYYPDKHQRNLAGRIDVTAGSVTTADANLEAGAMIRGRVYTDSSQSTPATGDRVTIKHPTYAGTVDRLRTNKAGKFRYWTVAGDYTIDAHGQKRDITAAVGSNSAIIFDKDVATIKGTLVATDASGNAVSSSPVSELFMRVSPITPAGKVVGYVSNDSASADGSFELYVDGYMQDGSGAQSVAAAGYVLYARADDQTDYGSGIYNGSDAFSRITYGTAKSTPLTPDAAGKQVLDLGTIKVPTSGDSNGGVGYLIGDAGMPAVSVKIGIGGTGNGKTLMGSASRGDNSIRVTLPVGTYYVYRDVFTSGTRTVATNNGAVCTAVEIQAGKSTTVTFGDESATTCTAGTPE